MYEVTSYNKKGTNSFCKMSVHHVLDPNQSRLGFLFSIITIN